MVRPISEVRKPAIIQGAISALNKHGLSMISYDLIAEEANMSRQLIRHYFPDPDALMVSVCDGLAAAHHEALGSGVVKVEPSKRLDLFLDLFFHVVGQGKVGKQTDTVAYDAMMAVATGSKSVRKCLLDHNSFLRSEISKEVQIAHPSLSASDCDEIGYLFVALVYGHWRLVTTLGFCPSYNDISRTAMGRLIASYLKD